MNYYEVVAYLKTLLEIPLNDEDSNFTRILPLMFAYADGRIYRELDFLPTLTAQKDALVPNGRELQVPDTVIVLRQLVIFTPFGVEVPTSTRNIPDRVSPEFLDMCWPQSSFHRGVPQKYAIIGFEGLAVNPNRQVLQQRLRLAPTPDKAYTCEYLGRIRPAILSPDNLQTYISVNYPELFCTACMVFGAGYQRDFGAQADDPQKAMSWDAQYNYLRAGIMLEAAQQRGEGPGWSAVPPAPAAQPRAP